MTHSIKTSSSASDFNIQPFLLLEPIKTAEMTKLQRFYKRYMYCMAGFMILCLSTLIALGALQFFGLLSADAIEAVPRYGMWLGVLMPLMLLVGLFLEIITPDHRTKERANMALRMEALATEQIDALIAHPQVDREVLMVAQNELLQRMRNQAL